MVPACCCSAGDATGIAPAIRGSEKTEFAVPAAGICCDLQGNPQISTTKPVKTIGPGRNTKIFLVLPTVISRHTSFVESRESSAHKLDALAAIEDTPGFNGKTARWEGAPGNFFIFGRKARRKFWPRGGQAARFDALVPLLCSWPYVGAANLALVKLPK